jgi:hypothetical protein
MNRGPWCVAAVVALLMTSVAMATADDEPRNFLIGSWEREGKVNIFSPDGTGKNNDGSRFRWELKGEHLIAKAQLPDGKSGEEWSVPIVFTKDKKEYSYLIGGENGDLKRITFYKLDQNNRRFSGRSEADRAYPPESEALKGEGQPGDPSLRPMPAK